MADLILHTDPLEFHNTRQSTKITYLQQEILQLQDHIRDLEQVVRINKEALRISTIQQSQSAIKNKHRNPNHNDTTTTVSTIENGFNQNNNRNLQLLVEQLQEENSKLLEIIEKIKIERNIAQSKALICEQISEETQRHEIEMTAELEEKIHDLRKLLQDKEYAIQELEKIKAIPEQEGVVVKYREVLNPSEQVLKLHNEIDSLNGMLTKVSKELNKQHNEKQELMTTNSNLMYELGKIRAILSNPLNSNRAFQSLKTENGPNTSADYATNLLTQPILEFSDASPAQLQHAQKKMTQFEIKNGKGFIPKFDQAQPNKSRDNKKGPEILKNNVHVDSKFSEELKQLEKELEIIRKKYSLEVLNNRLLSEEIASLQKEKAHLHAVNEILIKANKKNEEKAQKLFINVEFYKEFYHKYIDLITKRQVTHTRTASTCFNDFDKVKITKNKFAISDIEPSPNQFGKEFRHMEEDGKQVNVSVLDDQEEEKETEKVKEKTMYSGCEFTKEQSKLFLLNMAKDLYLNSNLQKSSIAKKMLRKLEFGKRNSTFKTVIKFKRSISNALDYLSERKKSLFEPKRIINAEKPNKSKKLKAKNKVSNDHDDELLQDEEKDDILAFVDESPMVIRSSTKKNTGELGFGGDEKISFTVDAFEFNKPKLADESFISTNEILNQIKHD